MDRQRRRKLSHFFSLASQKTTCDFYLGHLFRECEVAGRGEGTVLVLTDDEERLDDDVADHADAVGVDEAGVVGHDDGDVEGSDQDQPIPAGLEHAVVRQDEAGLLEGAGLVLG